MDANLSRLEIADILHFYMEAGLDFPLEEVAQNRLIEAAKLDLPVPVLSTQKPTPRPAMAMPSSAVIDDGAVARARELAKNALDLEALRATLEAFDGCSLQFTAKNLVFADGNPTAKIMLIGDAPGRDEDLEGRPFVGMPGQLLDRMLGAVGLTRTHVYTIHNIYWRPPGNRKPTPMETEICRPFIERHIELIDPDLAVFVGEDAAKGFLPKADAILRMRGQWQEWALPSGRVIPALPILHPSYLLHQRAQKKLAWRDMLNLKAKIVSMEIDV